jgi:hypothetical protein
MKKVVTAGIILLVFIVSIVFVFNSKNLSNGTAIIVADNFILTFLGMFASLAIAIIAFLYSNVEKIRITLINANHDKKAVIELQFDKIFKELKDNTLLTLINLILCFFVVIFRDIDINFIIISIKFITKMQLVSIIKLSLTFLTFIAITDIFIALFNLIKVSKQIEISQEEQTNAKP